MDGALEHIDGKVNGTLSGVDGVTGALSPAAANMQGSLSTSDEIRIRDYNRLANRPSIEGITLEGDKTFKQLGMDTLSVQEIEKILYL